MVPGSEIGEARRREDPSDEAFKGFVDNSTIQVVVEKGAEVGEEGIGEVDEDGKFASIVLDDGFVKEGHRRNGCEREGWK